MFVWIISWMCPADERYCNNVVFHWLGTLRKWFLYLYYGRYRLWCFYLGPQCKNYSKYGLHQWEKALVTLLCNGPWEIWMKFYISKFQGNFSYWWLRYRISCEIALRWLSLDLTDGKFREWLGAIRQQAITWANVDPDLCRHMASLGPSELSSVSAAHLKIGHLKIFISVSLIIKWVAKTWLRNREPGW